MTANMSKCSAVQFSDQMSCNCGNVWDMNDPYPPECREEPTDVEWAERNDAAMEGAASEGL